MVYTAFNHDFSRFAANAEQDRTAIDTLDRALEDSAKLLLVTSSVALLAPGRLATEADAPPLADPAYPRKSDAVARRRAARGARVGTVWLAPSVHGVGDHGFLSILVDLARRTGVSA